MKEALKFVVATGIAFGAVGLFMFLLETFGAHP